MLSVRHYPSFTVRAGRGVLGVLLGVAVLPTAPAAGAIDSLIGESLPADVCQVTRTPASTDCSAPTVTIEPSSDGQVGSRVVVRLAVPPNLRSAQIVSARIKLTPVEAEPPEHFKLLWGASFDPANDPAAVFAGDPYFWTGESGDEDAPRGGSETHSVRWRISEVLARARAQRSAPLDLYFDADQPTTAATYYGPGAADESKRPKLIVAYRQGTGYRSEQSYREVQSTATHRYVVNAGTGNVLIDAIDGDVPGVGPIQRFSNTAARQGSRRDAGRWNSVYEARQAWDTLDTSVWWDFPTGESTSIDTTEIFSGANYENDSVDQSSGNHPTEAGWHRTFLDGSGRYQSSAVDPDGIRRVYTFGGPSVYGIIPNGWARSLEIQSNEADGEQTSTEVDISNDAERIDISAPGGSYGASAPKVAAELPGEHQLDRWTTPSQADPEVPEDVVRYVYDAAGHLVRAEIPGVGKVRYSFNEAGQLVRITDTDGSVVKLAYDDQERVTQLRRLDSEEDPDDAAEWDRREYIDGVAPECAADAGTERSVRETMSSGSSIVYCVSGAGRVIADHQDDPALPDFAPVVCPAGDTDCADGGPAQTPVASGARARRALAACATPVQPGMDGLLGIGDDYWQDDDHSIFASKNTLSCLAVKTVRRIVPWNLVATKYWTRTLKDDGTKDLESDPAHMQRRLDSARRWVSDALDNDLNPMISFDLCPLEEKPQSKKTPPCDKPPTPVQYQRAVKAFLKDETFKRVKLYTAFNEPNHKRSVKRNNRQTSIYYLARPLAKGSANAYTDKSGPYLAGHYFRILSQLCKAPRGCKVYAGDFSDVESRDRPFKFEDWLDQYLKGMKSTANVSWSAHYYLTMRERSTNAGACTKPAIKPGAKQCWGRMARIMKALSGTRTGQVPWWLTEGGEVYHQNGEETAWAGLHYGGPKTAYDANDRGPLREQPGYRTQAQLLKERVTLSGKYNATIERIFSYQLNQPINGAAFDSALFGSPTPPGPGQSSEPNALDESPRPAYLALCELVRGENATDCWQGAGPPDPDDPDQPQDQ